MRNIDIYIKSINHFVLACLHLYIFCYFEKETESFNNKKKRSLRYPQHFLNSISTINDFVFYWNRLILSPSETTETTRRLCLHLRNGTYERWWLLDLMLFLFLLLTSEHNEINHKLLKNILWTDVWGDILIEQTQNLPLHLN